MPNSLVYYAVLNILFDTKRYGIESLVPNDTSYSYGPLYMHVHVYRWELSKQDYSDNVPIARPAGKMLKDKGETPHNEKKSHRVSAEINKLN